MLTNRCDFCKNQIPPGEANISYMPCLHAICLNCRVSRFRAVDKITCAVCNTEASVSQIFDFYIPDPLKRLCQSGKCDIKLKAPVKRSCTTCKKYLCEPCGNNHAQYAHNVEPTEPAIPPRSRCPRHPDCPVTFFCNCGMQLCDTCAESHPSSPTHMKTSFVYLAMKAKEKMNGVKNATDQEIGKLVKHLPTIDKNKKALQEVCSQIRMQIAQDVVDLCNAVIRRGNDLVTAIDLAEDAKTKQYTQSETELRIHKDRLSKIEQFATVGMHSTVFDDPTVVHACSFLESACHVVNSKRENVQANLIYSQKVPQLRYLSDATPLNNALRTFGALDIDGSIKTPQSTTHPQARMFSIATGSAQPHSSSTVHRMTTPNGVRIRGPSVPMSTMAGGATISSISSMPLAMPSHQNGHRMMMSNNNHAQYMAHRAAGSHIGSPTTLTPGTSPTSMMPVLNNQGGLRTHFPRLAPRMMAPSTSHMMVAPTTPQSAASATATAHIRPTATAVIPPATAVIHQHGSARRKGHPERLTSEALNGDEVLAIDTPSTSTGASVAEKSSTANAATDTGPPKTASVSTGMMVSPARPNRTDSAPLASTQTGPGQVAGKKPSTSSDSGIASRPASSSAVEANGIKAKRPSAESGQEPPEAKRTCPEKVSGLNGLTSAAAFAPRSAVADQEGPAEVAVPTDTSPTAPISCENSNGSHADAGEKEADPTTSAAAKALDRQRSAATEQEEEEGDENEETDAWDDYCFVCNQGCDDDTGELGCCAGCPRVYHNQCHVPRIHDKMANLPDDWKCTLCVQCEPLRSLSERFGKQEKLLSSKVLLACFIVHQEAEPFLNEVSREHDDYYTVIKQPMCFRTIARRISYDVYQNPLEFIQDMNLVFQNCSKFNAPSSEVANAGKSVYSLFVTAVAAHLPAYQRHVWIYVCHYQEKNVLDDDEYNPRTSRKKSPALKRVRKEITS